MLALKRVRLSNAWLCCQLMRLEVAFAPSVCSRRVYEMLPVMNRSNQRY